VCVGGGGPWSNKAFQFDVLIVFLPDNGLLGHVAG